MNRYSIFACVMFVVISISTFSLVQKSLAVVDNNSCINLNTDLYFGSTDSNMSHSVLTLQKFLANNGYMSAIPSGYFGTATLSAVKRFQTVYSISSTGRVGPLTRATLKKISCNQALSINSVVTSQTASVSNSYSTNSASNINITQPSGGSRLTIGKTYPIVWTAPLNYIYKLILESPTDSGAGYIIGNLSGGNSYSWQAGKVYSSDINDYQNIATGTYRIRIEKNSSGMSRSDLLSDWFTLNAPPLVITSLFPQSVPNDDRTTVIMYGSGFNSLSSVRLDGPVGMPINAQYVSVDGTAIVFSIPNYVSTGRHSVVVVGSSGEISNYINLSVTNAIVN